MSTAEIAFISGLVEGEGCFTREVTRRKDGRVITPRLSVTNTCVKIVDWLEAIAGGYVCSQNRGIYQILYQWRLRGEAALALTKRMLRWLKIKIAQATLFVQYRVSRRKGEMLSREDHDFNYELSQEIARLNKRASGRGGDGGV